MAEPALQQRLLSVGEYLCFEAESPVRHEYVRGMIYALAGVTRQHSQIATNISWRIAAAAAGGPCRVHPGGVKLQIGDIFYYPDIMVACGTVPNDPNIDDAPLLVVEVTSPTTKAIDRREKLMIYRQIPSLRAYLIVDQGERHVERHWRDEQGQWRFGALTDEETISVPGPEVTLSLEEIYQGVE